MLSLKELGTSNYSGLIRRTVMNARLKLTVKEGVSLKHLAALFESIDGLYKSLCIAFGDIDTDAIEKARETLDGKGMGAYELVPGLYVESCLRGSININLNGLGKPLGILVEWITSVIDPQKRRNKKLLVDKHEIENEMIKRDMGSEEFMKRIEAAEAGVDFVTKKALPMYDALKARGFPEIVCTGMFVASMRWMSQIARVQGESKAMTNLECKSLPE